MISVYTITMGRELYLNRLFESVKKYGGDISKIEHHVMFNGCAPSKKIHSSYGYFHNQEKEVIPVGAAMNKIVPKLTGNLIMKMDDDCVIRSPDFFDHVQAISELIPGFVFSPYPVGLIGNPGGVPSKDHFVSFSEKTNTYYCFRIVDHIGGFARISPADVAKNVKVKDTGHNEDVEFSTYCKQNNIPMVYLENALIVEHQESTLGQHERYPNYFKGRF